MSTPSLHHDVGTTIACTTAGTIPDEPRLRSAVRLTATLVPERNPFRHVMSGNVPSS